MSRRLLWIVASIVAMLALVVWFVAPRAVSTPQTAGVSPGAEQASEILATQPGAGPIETFSVSFQTTLVPDGVFGALPNSVRIGLAYVAPEDAQAYQEAASGSVEGAGPSSYSELATVERWVSATAQKLADGSVRVGPINLARADRYDLQAKGESPLHFYTTSFTADRFPAFVTPTVAAGIKVLREPAEASDARVLLRRVGEAADAAAWHALMSDEAPQLIAAFGETSLAVTTSQILAPLPPGPIEVLLEVDGIMAERQSVVLTAGKLTDIRFDPVKQAVAQAVAVTLELAFIVEGSAQPVEGLEVAWVDHDALPRRSDAAGRVTFQGIDRQQAHRFNVQFPISDAVLPQWPTQKTIEVAFENETGAEAARTIRRTVELRPLQWLVVRTGTFQVPTQRTVGNPYPIFVLQQARAGRWVDDASEHFIPVSEGIAVSFEEPGQFRIAALQSPWSIWYSTAEDISQDSRDGKYRAALIPDAGRTTEITLLSNGIPVSNTQFSLSAPVRGLPATTMTSDSFGRVRLEAVTVPSVRIEVPGFAVAEVNLRSAIATVELQSESILSER